MKLESGKEERERFFLSPVWRDIRVVTSDRVDYINSQLRSVLPEDLPKLQGELLGLDFLLHDMREALLGDFDKEDNDARI